MNLGMVIFYDNITGEVLVNTGEYKDVKDKKTIEQQINTYSALKERERDSFDYIELAYGDYRADFASMNGYRVNPETKTLEFSYPDPNEPGVEQPYQAPLSEQIAELMAENVTTLEAIAEVYELVLGGA